MNYLQSYDRGNLPANIDQRVKKSKFAALIKGLNDTQLKTLFAVLAGDQKLVAAVDCWQKSVEHQTQAEALVREIRSRNL